MNMAGTSMTGSNGIPIYRGVVDINRIYLTGLSMGGRGTLIVASEFPNMFAGIMVLSPHHEPFDYTPVADQVKHVPIFLSHGTWDTVSQYGMAESFKNRLISAGMAP